MQKRFLCLMLCLAIVLPVGSFALAAEGIQAEEEAAPYFLVDGIAYEDPGLTVYNNITYVSLMNAVLALRPDAVITWEGEYAVVSAEGLTDPCPEWGINTSKPMAGICMSSTV